MIDLAGQRFGRLVAIRPLDERAPDGSVFWLCRCDCGATSRIRSWQRKTTRSCGCLSVETARKTAGERFRTHGLRRSSRAYGIWAGMIQRCTNPNVASYRYYGAKGVKVCERWMKFENFFADMGEAPSGLSIDRIDAFGDYEPGNCRWATAVEQARNKRGRSLAT